MIATDKVAVEEARSKSRNEKNKQKEFQQIVWEESQAAIRLNKQRKQREESKDRDMLKIAEDEIERNVRDRSQQRRVGYIDLDTRRKNAIGSENTDGNRQRKEITLKYGEVLKITCSWIYIVMHNFVLLSNDPFYTSYDALNNKFLFLLHNSNFRALFFKYFSVFSGMLVYQY